MSTKRHVVCAPSYTQIRACLSDLMADGPVSDLSEQRIRQALRERGLVDDVLKSLALAEGSTRQPMDAPASHAGAG